MSTHTNLSTLPPEAKHIRKYYDDWAASYNDTLADWEYDCPRVAASLLLERVKPTERILDAGCGTGLTGRALADQGATNITGLDLSQQSLDIAAEAGVYAELINHSLQALPLPIADDAFDGLECVGVFSYLREYKTLLEEYCRVVRPKGTLVFTQRTDHYADFDFPAAVQSVVDAGHMTVLYESKPMPYLPGHEEFAEKVLVVYFVCEVNESRSERS